MTIQHSRGTGTSNCLVHKMMNYQMAKKQKRKKPAYQRPSTVLFLLQLLLLVKFSLFCVVVFLWRSDVWWTGDQLALLYSVFICSSFTSFWVIPYKSKRFFGLFIVFSIFASVFNHRLLFMISWCTFHSPEDFARNTTSRAWGKWLTSHKLHGWGGWVVVPWTWLSRDSVQAPCNN